MQMVIMLSVYQFQGEEDGGKFAQHQERFCLIPPVGALGAPLAAGLFHHCVLEGTAADPF